MREDTLGCAPANIADEMSPSSEGILVGVGVAVAASLAARARAQMAGDTMILNALLSAEYQAVKAYDAGASILMSPPGGDPLASAAATVLAVAAHFQAQHRDHADALAGQIVLAGGVPVAEESVIFTPPEGFSASVLNVIRLAANAEKAAAVAYADTLKTVSSQMVARLLASIGGVESEHYIILSLLAQGVIAPTEATMAMATQLVPTAFVTAQNGELGLGSVPDFNFS